MTTIVVAKSYGGPEALAVEHAELRKPGPNEVAVSVRAIGANPIDFKVYSGAMGRDPSKLPMRIGYEAAGVVTAIAEPTSGPGGPIRVGDEVIVYRVTGAYASELVVPASAVVPKPSTLSFEAASGLMLTGTTAAHCLKATGVGAGDTVVIHGASGGVGLMAVQLAKLLGARVIGTASEARHAYLRKLGAEPVAYGPGLVERIRAVAPNGVNAAIDAVGTDEAIDASIALVADRKRIATIAAFARGPGLGIKVLGGAPGADAGEAIRSAARMELVKVAQASKLEVVVAKVFPLAEVAAAHRELASGHTHGKIVLVP